MLPRKITAIGTRDYISISIQKACELLATIFQTVDGFLPCTGVKEGWFNGDSFYR